jgi:cytochrome c2
VPIATPSLSGASVFQEKACYTCHVVNGQGGRSGPELSQIATIPYDGLANTPDFLSKYLENPQAQKTDALMPAVPMTVTERDALVQYLMTLK